VSIWAVSVTKKASWKGALELHSNIYHYKIPLIEGAGSMTITQAEALLADVVATEKTIMSNSHTYTTGRVWGPVELGKAVSDTVLIKDLTGTGGLSARGAYVSLADCVVISMRTGRDDARSRPVYLRKYMRTLIGPGGGVFGSNQVAQIDPLNTSDVNAAVAFADNIAGVDSGTFLNTPGILCSPTGATVPASVPRVVKVAGYLESHELRY
jgi:hypothetical protein